MPVNCPHCSRSCGDAHGSGSGTPLRGLTRRAVTALGSLGLLGLFLNSCSDEDGQAPAVGDGGSASGDDDSSSGDDDSSSGDDDSSSGDDDSSSGDDDSASSIGPEHCDETESNPEGPFYAGNSPVRNQLNLYGDTGTELLVTGRVLDADCAPLPFAVLEIWHDDPKGVYDNSSPEMRYRAQMAADANGNYGFHTLVPGPYLNGSQYRPAHIHAKLWVGGVERLTTQLYFRDDPYNSIDGAASDALMLDYSVDGSGTWIASFNFVLPQAID